MFRIKKDDYNTVQFLPDFQSGGHSRRKQRRQKPARAVESADTKERKARVRNRMLLVIIVLAVLLLAAGFVYLRFFTEQAQYIRLFRQAEYSRCEQIAGAHLDDPAFKKKIENTVIGATNGAVTHYLEGSADADTTQQLLEQYNQASGRLFEQYIGDNQHWIQTVEGIYLKADQAADEARRGVYTESITTLQQVAEEASKNGLVLDQQIRQILRDNLNGYKAELFVGFANTIRYEEDDTTIIDTINFVKKYIEDDDFNEYLNTVEKVRSGEYTRITAARAARQIAKDAGADIEVNEGSGSSPSSSSSGSSGRSSSRSSSSSSAGSTGSSGSSGSSGSGTSQNSRTES